MNPKYYLLWLHNKELEVQQDIVLESKTAGDARSLAEQIISDDWTVTSVELFDQE